MKKTEAGIETEFFDLLDRLLSFPKLSVEAVAEVTNIDFALLDHDDSFETFHGMSRNRLLLDGAELRIPGPRAQSIDGMLILKIKPTNEIGLKQIVGHFGEPELEIISPPRFSWALWIQFLIQSLFQSLFRRVKRAPHEYYTYTSPGGSLSFGCQDRKPCRLVELIIDRTDRK